MGGIDAAQWGVQQAIKALSLHSALDSCTAYIAPVRLDASEAIEERFAPNEVQIQAYTKHGITKLSFWVDKIGEKNLAFRCCRIYD